MEERAAERGWISKQNKSGGLSAWNEIDIACKGKETLGLESFENIVPINVLVYKYGGTHFCKVHLFTNVK